MRLLIVAAAALMLPTAALAQQDAAQQTAAADPDKKICKKVQTTGTRLGAKKVCATKAEWDEVARKAREFTTGIQRGAGRTGMPTAGPNG